MSLRLGALEDALVNAGSEPELARKAAEEGADGARQLTDLRGALKIVQWMLGVVLLLLVWLFWLGFTMMGRLS